MPKINVAQPVRPESETSKAATKKKKHIVMLAAENGALIGGKEGGIGDVLRDLPHALAVAGHTVTVVTPSYGFLHARNPAKALPKVRFVFAGKEETAEVFQLKPERAARGVRHVVIEHPWMRGNPIYIHDPDERPFASDASKYALFCSAAGQLIQSRKGLFKNADVIHLHDWHAATVLLLRRLHPAFRGLRDFRMVFTIHNLGIQGTRPIQGDESSLAAWFPEIFAPEIASDLFNHYADYRYGTPCYTPMAAGIALADAVNTVSPSYAEEILAPSDPAAGFWGGEGLEWIVRPAKDDGRLFGILGGVDYPVSRKTRKLKFPELCEVLIRELTPLVESSPNPDRIQAALVRLEGWKGRDPKAILTAVARVTDQKVRLFFEKGSDGRTALQWLLGTLETYDGVFILLGSGMPWLENELAGIMHECGNFLFINAMSLASADLLYVNGTMFLMPSLYEPCGLSQLLAMREGQPAVVSAVGGLKDTVKDRENGFSFSGANPAEKVENFLRVVEEALKMRKSDPKTWKAICKNAKAARFTWETSARAYVEKMYK